MISFHYEKVPSNENKNAGVHHATPNNAESIEDHAFSVIFAFFTITLHSATLGEISPNNWKTIERTLRFHQTERVHLMYFKRQTWIQSIGDVISVMVEVVRNEISDPRSNSGRG